MVVLADDASPVPLFSQLHCNTAAQLQHIKLNCTTAAATQLLLLHNSDQLQKKPIGRQPDNHKLPFSLAGAGSPCSSRRLYSSLLKEEGEYFPCRRSRLYFPLQQAEEDGYFPAAELCPACRRSMCFLLQQEQVVVSPAEGLGKYLNCWAFKMQRRD